MHHTQSVTETFEAFLRPFTDGDSGRDMARKTGIEQTKLRRNIKGRTPVATVAQLCRSYSIPFLDAFVAAGFITEAEADVIGRSRGLRHATERELVTELMQRVKDGEASEVITEPVEQEIIDEVAERRARQDVGGAVEADEHAGKAQAANTDRSADGLDPETT
jgi:hypothetical protein